MNDLIHFIKNRIKSIGFAIEGFLTLIKEPNVKVHIFASILVIIFGFYFEITTVEWGIIIFCIALVLSLEAINTAIENIADFISPQKNNKIKIIKDVSATAVLIVAIGTFIIGLIIFIPKILAKI
ncbi:diacylglycerol kinase family protein [Ornithobacterium rhinotracheale]|uniref:diacylglycerol kinase family protein n=1 Tax=Ornithobacterium rhinotracheale TaxID=28251 RepID=UPI00129C7D9C|nr:diacylglycerol kinase family protein [Ornithobacterium rhinotracheale]MRJ10968.1 diacylglycerol kinase family protein [Ornithobacterium rhinotracheale]